MIKIQGVSVINLNIKDNSGSNKDVYVSIIGYQGNQWPAGANSVWSYVKIDGSVDVCASGQSLQDFSFKLSEFTGKEMPYLSSGRVSISFDSPLTSNPIASGNQMPYPSTTDVNDVNWNTIWDKVEFSNQQKPPTTWVGCDVDVTLVDGFSFPMNVTLTGGQFGAQTKGGMTVTREEMFKNFRTMSKDFTEQIVVESGNDIRVLSPAAAVSRVSGTGPAFPDDFLNSYIDTCWKTYSEGQTLTIDMPAYSGSVAVGTVNSKNNEFVFVDQFHDTFIIPKPTTSEVLGCNGVFVQTSSGNAWHQQKDGIVKMTVAGYMNRGVLQNKDNYCDDKTFYPSGTSCNEYAKMIHEFSVSGNNYAFPYDDACNKYSANLADTEPTSVEIELLPWK